MKVNSSITESPSNAGDAPWSQSVACKVCSAFALLFLIGVFAAGSATAQHEVTGEVIDADDGVTLPGVNIVVQGTETGTTTRTDGTFTVTAPSGDDVLVFTFVGYQRQEVPIEGRSEISVLLEPSVSALDEIVVQVGYEERGVETVTGSVSQVSGADLELQPTSNVSQMLQGTVPGLIGVQESGRPGHDNVNLLVRGSSTLNDNSPLVVIDGVPGRQGGLARLNPNDIESISVLKDASAAIYGSRAANGVILVTTRRGNPTGGAEFSATVRQSYSQPTVIPQMTDAPTYMQMLNEVDEYRGGTPRYSQEAIERHTNPPADSWEYFDTDWYDEALRSFVPSTMANVSVGGGTELLRYRVSLRGVTEQGILVNSGESYDQLGFRSNLDGQVSDNFSMSLDLHGRLEDRTTATWTRGLDSAWEMLQRGYPTEPAFWPDGSPGPAQEQGVNPVVGDRTGYHDTKDYYFQGTLTGQFDVPTIDGWTAEASISYDQNNTGSRWWQEPWTLYNFGGFDEAGQPQLIANDVGVPDPRLEQTEAINRDILARATTRYETTIGPHYGSILLGTEYSHQQGSNMGAFRRYFPTNQIDLLFAGGTEEQNIWGSAWHSARMNYFGRASYNYEERYLLELIARYDGSSIFPEGERFGFFPSASLGWNVAQEEWFSNDFFNRLQLRSSFGQTGNDRIEAYQFLRTFGFTGQFAYADGLNPTAAPTRVPNPDITWEVATQFDIGVRTGMMDDRLTADFTYFRQLRDDILWFRSESVPQSAGFRLPRENIGQVRSHGGEAEVNFVQVIGANFMVRLGANATVAFDEVVDIDEPEGLEEWQRAEGAPMNTSLYYVSDGIFRDWDEIENNPSWPGARPGDVRFRDVNGDGVIDGQDRVRMDVNSEPDIMGSFNLGASYGDFDLDLQFQGATRVHHFVFTDTAGEFGNYFQFFADQRWTPDNPDASGPRAYNRAEPYWASNANSAFLQDASYLRLKNLRFGYSLPERWVESFGANRLRIQLTGQNLLTFTPLVGMDPEIRHGGAHSYPPSRMYSLELQLSF